MITIFLLLYLNKRNDPWFCIVWVGSTIHRHSISNKYQSTISFDRWFCTIFSILISNTTPNISFFIRSKSIKFRFIYKNYFESLFSYPIQMLFSESNSSSMIFSEIRSFFLTILLFYPNSFNRRSYTDVFVKIWRYFFMNVLNLFASDE